MNNYLVVCSILLLTAAGSCDSFSSQNKQRDYRKEMVSFVSAISEQARKTTPGFLVIPQNGIQLLARQREDWSLVPNTRYLQAIDGIGRESVFYGYTGDNEATPEGPRDYINTYLELARDQGKTVMITDYAWDRAKVDSSYRLSHERGYISFAANKRSLTEIPPYPEQPYGVNRRDILRLDDAENFLYLINPANFSDKEHFLQTLSATNYDMLVIDLFLHGQEALTRDDLSRLSVKQNGGRRLVIAYMSIGEAEEYRYYWDETWESFPPDWLGAENPVWEGNYLVRYWDPEWQSYIYGSEDSYLQRIMNAGFDGVYLDLVDAYRRFEE